MEESPAKRRKTSPTTSIAIDAPATPSRIPVPTRHGENTTPGRPSYVSPTKASLSRHNPQLLKRPPSSGLGARGNGSPGKGKSVQNLFAKSPGKIGPADDAPSMTIGGDRMEGTKSTPSTRENVPQATNSTSQRTTPKSRGMRTAGGALSAKPRRLSQSPSKRPQKTPVAPADDPFSQDLPHDFNPFQKKGLRRSPISSQAGAGIPPQDDDNPFRKTGLRRSPISSQVDDQVYSQGTHDTGGKTEKTKSPSPSNSNFEIQLSSEGGNDVPLGAERNKSPTQAVHSGTHMLPKEGDNQFMGRDLRRSPVHHLSPMNINSPSRGNNSRKSSVLGQPINTIKQKPDRIDKTPEVSTTPTEPLPSHNALAEVISKDHPQEKKQLDQQPIFTKVADLLHRKSSRQEREEPELPPTPTQRGIPDPVVTTPPSGIHDTPSKRSRKRAAKFKSSPLKPHYPAPARPAPSEIKEKSGPEPFTRRKSARFLTPVDPHAAKKKERDDLLKELQQLQEDVTLANQENERLRLRAESQKNKPITTPNVEDLVAMLLRSTAPEPSSNPKPKVDSIFKNIGSFLPFRPRRKPVTTVISQKPLPSHLPIHLDDPLPYLQAFSPLTYTSTITLLPQEPVPSPDSADEPESENSIFQRHVINASHHSGLFASRFSMTVDTASLTISSLEILRLDMSAEKELGTFIRSRARASGPLGRDVTAICWAMGRWIEVSIERARFWCDVEEELGTAEARRKPLHKKRKRKRGGAAAAIGDEDGKEAGHNEGKVKWARRQLLPNIGRTALELSSKDVELRFEWKVGFDWTGEVESSISANARVPRNWQEKDDRKSLGKVPETFSKLVKERGPLGAARAIVGLFMPT